jgi:hypothetical protein
MGVAPEGEQGFRRSDSGFTSMKEVMAADLPVSPSVKHLLRGLPSPDVVSAPEPRLVELEQRENMSLDEVLTETQGNMPAAEMGPNKA